MRKEVKSPSKFKNLLGNKQQSTFSGPLTPSSQKNWALSSTEVNDANKVSEILLKQSFGDQVKYQSLIAKMQKERSKPTTPRTEDWNLNVRHQNR